MLSIRPAVPRNRSFRPLVLVLGLLVPLAASSADAQSLVGTVAAGGKFYDLRPFGAPRNLRESGLGSIASIAFDGKGNLYALTNISYGYDLYQVHPSLWLIDVATGTPTWIGNPHINPGSPTGGGGRLLFDSSRDTMFLQYNTSLYKIDLATCRLTHVLDFHFELRPPDAPTYTLGVLAYSFDDSGRLWATFRITPFLTRPPRFGIGQIDLTTGAIASLIPLTYWGSTTIYPSVGQNLVFDPRTQSFLTNDRTNLHRIHPDTGHVSELTNTSLPGSGDNLSLLAAHHPSSVLGGIHTLREFPMLSIVRGGYVHDRRTGDFVQRLSLTSDRPITGPISVVVIIWSSSSGVSLKNASGLYNTGYGTILPYVSVLPATDALRPGVPTEVILRFGNPLKTHINYFMYVLGGDDFLDP